MIRELIITLVTVWQLDLAAAVAVAAAVLFYKQVMSKKAAARNRPRALRWRIKLKLRPGPGYASLVELLVRWSRPAAFFHGRRARPGLTCVIADRIVDHPGAVLATSTKADLLGTTGADRARLGPVHVFNPQGVGDVRSTLRWDMLGPCRDLVMARRMAAWLTGGAKGSGHGNIEWFEQKGEVALAGLLFAASVSGSTISDVFRWVQLDGHQAAIKALADYGTPEMLAVVRRMLADNRTAGSVRDTIELSLAWAAIPGLAEAVTPRRGDAVFDVEGFGLGRGTLYMIASGDEDSPVTPLFRALASYVHYEAGLIGTRTRAGRLDPPLLMALDEVAVVCPVDLPAMLADAAGKGILIQPVVHGVSQLEGRWGKDGAATIWATCGTKLLLPGISDADTLEAVSKLCGSVTGTPPHDRPVRVVPPELLRTLPDWHALVVRMNLSPVVVRVRPVWKRPERRFPMSYLRPRPPLPALPDRSLPLPWPSVPAELPETVPAAQDFTDTWGLPEDPDLVPVPQDGGRPWDAEGPTSA
jgi:hypothetical protein